MMLQYDDGDGAGDGGGDTDTDAVGGGRRKAKQLVADLRTSGPAIEAAGACCSWEEGRLWVEADSDGDTPALQQGQGSLA